MITPEQLAGESEDSQQKALFCWISLNQRAYPLLMRCFAIPNGGFRNIREAAKLKAMGVRKGISDIMFPVPRGSWHGLFIELKRLKGGTTSEEQKEWIVFLKSQGYGAVVCYGWLAARDTLIKYLEYKE